MCRDTDISEVVGEEVETPTTGRAKRKAAEVAEDSMRRKQNDDSSASEFG